MRRREEGAVAHQVHEAETGQQNGHRTDDHADVCERGPACVQRGENPRQSTRPSSGTERLKMSSAGEYSSIRRVSAAEAGLVLLDTGVAAFGFDGHAQIIPAYPATPMKNLDLSLLRFMRTRGHTPVAEKAAKLIAKSGENGYLWLGIDLPVPRSTHRAALRLASAAIGPAAIGLNFGIKLIVQRPRPTLEGLPPLGGAPSSPSSLPPTSPRPSRRPRRCLASLPNSSRRCSVPPLPWRSAGPIRGMHYPSDVVAGALLGSVLGRLVPIPAGNI